MAPWHDVTPCAKCGGPTVLRGEHDRGGDYPPRVGLICVSCGHGSGASVSEIARNAAASLAWAVERKRREAARAAEQAVTP